MNKRILAMMMAVVCALTMLTACGSKEETTPAPDSAFSVDLNRFYTEIMDAAEEGPMMMDLTADAELLEVMYPGLGAVETKQLVLASPAMSAVAIEFAFAEVANAADVETVKNIFQTRIDTQVAGGAWYPETIEGWKNNSEIVVIDNYVCLFVCAEKDGMIEALRNGTEVPAWAKAQAPAEDEGDAGIMDMPVEDGPAAYDPEADVPADMPAYDPEADVPAAAPVAPENMPVEQEPAVVEPAPGEPVAIDLTQFVFDLADKHGENFAANTDVVEFGMHNDLYPGIGDIATNQLVIYQPMMGAVVCEIALAEVADAADAEAMKAVFQARIDAQVDGGAWYPESILGWENNSRIVTNGNFVMMIAWQFCDDAVADFNALF